MKKWEDTLALLCVVLVVSNVCASQHVWRSNSNSLYVDQTCEMDSSQHAACRGGGDETSETQCINDGCCYNPIPDEGKPHCYHKIDMDKCAFAEEERQDCGLTGPTAESCQSAGCCYDNTILNVPWCFFPQISVCDNVASNERLDCGYKGITQGQCLDLGCCHDSSVSNVPHCFEKTSSPKVEFHSYKSDWHPAWIRTHRGNFVFTVQACEATVDLSDSHGFRDGEGINYYKVYMGPTQINVTRWSDGKLLDQKAIVINDFVKCNEASPVYIIWNSHGVKVGTSADNILCSMDHENDWNVYAARLATPSGVEGWWTWRKDQGSSINAMLVAHPTITYDHITVGMDPQQTSAVFKLEGCNPFYMLLHENRNNIENYAYEIMFGASENQLTSVERKGTADSKYTMATPGILNCDGYKYFWVSWANSHVMVGSGPRVGLGQVIDYNYGGLNPVRFISVDQVSPSDTHEYADRFEYVGTTESLFYVSTPGTYNEDAVTVHMNTHGLGFMFSVQACHGAHVLLAERSGDYTIEIVIGEKMERAQGGYADMEVTYIQDYGMPSTRVMRETNGILDCTQVKSFWINWESKKVVLGRGKVFGQHSILTSGRSINIDGVSGIGLRTAGDTLGNVGEWAFLRQQVGKVLVSTPNSGNYDTVWQSTNYGTDPIYFRVHSCSDAYIVLGEYPGILNSNSFEIRIGTSGNQETELWVGGNRRMSSRGTYLECDQWVWFWLYWTDTQLYFGEGTMIDVNGIIQSDLSTTAPPVFAMMGAASGTANTGEALWDFDVPQTHQYTVLTRNGADFRGVKFLVMHPYFRFSLNSCSMARILMIEDEDSMYEVIIGDSSNTRTSIKRGEHNVASEATLNVLNCDHALEFWISWIDQTIAVGTGSDIGMNVLVSYESFDEEDLSHMHLVELRSDDSHNAIWKISESSVVGTQVTTANEYTYNQFWLGVEDASSVVFRVRASNDAHLALSQATTTPGLTEVREVILGASSNNRTVIRNKRLEQDITGASTPDILSADEDRYFWISWLSGTYNIGTGSKIGHNVILSCEEENRFHPSTVSISTGFGSTGEWSFTVVNVDFFSLSTEGVDYETNSIMPKTELFSFVVRACEQIHIAIYSDNRDRMAYELVIGATSNRVTYIRKDEESSWPSSQEWTTLFLLDCYELRTFYLFWTEKEQSFSLYDQHMNEVFIWVDIDYKAPEMISLGSLRKTEWYFARLEDDKVDVYTYSERALQSGYRLAENPADNPPALITEHADKYETIWLAVHEETTLFFSVKACAEANVILTTYYGVPEFDSTEIIIGTESDGDWIHIIRNGKQCKRVMLADILDCVTMKRFWLRWDDDNVRLGRGDAEGEEQIIQCTLPAIHVSGISFASAGGNEAQWSFGQIHGEVLAFTTPYSVDIPWKYERASIVPRQDWMSFDVQAPAFAVVSLCEDLWVTNTRCHEIHIGRTDDKKETTTIRDVETGEIKASASTNNILSESSFRPFWISFADGYIRLGYGRIRTNVPLVHLKSPVSHNINSISFATPIPSDDGQFHMRGFWRIPRDFSRYTELKLDSTDNVVKASVLGSYSFIFTVLSKKTVYLVLHPYVGLEAAGSYIIGIGSSNGYEIYIEQNGNRLVTHKVKELLSTTYWVSWYDGVLHVGCGGEINERIYISYSANKELTFHEVLLSSEETSEWIWTGSSSNGFNLITNQKYGYDLAWMDVKKSFVTFRVRTCNDAHLLLSTTKGQTDASVAYEIVFGASENRALYLRRGTIDDHRAGVQLPGIVDCDQLRRFWVKWDESGVIQVGSGEYSSIPLIYYTDPDPITAGLQYAAVSAWNSVYGEWEFSRTEAEELFLHSPADMSFDYQNAYLTTQGYNYVKFRVQAQEKAMIALSQVPNVQDFRTYEFVLGSQHGGKGVTFLGGAVQIDSQSDKVILSSEESRDFWLYWKGRQFMIGSGKELRKNTLLDVMAPEQQYETGGVSFKTGEGVEGNFSVTDIGRDTPGGGLSGGAVAGIVIGVLLLVAAASFIAAIILIPSFKYSVQSKWETTYARFSSSGSSSDRPTSIDPAQMFSDIMAKQEGGAETFA